MPTLLNDKQNTISCVLHWLTIRGIWSLCLPLTEAIKLRLLRKRELVALLLLNSVDVMLLLSFFASSSRCLGWSIVPDCCISSLNSHTFFLHDKAILYDVYVLTRDTFV